MRILLTITGFLLLNYVTAQKSQVPLIVTQCQDFELTGKGNNAEWTKTGWNTLSRLDTSGGNFESKFKILYSSTGIYLLFDGKDNKITTPFTRDFENLYEGDVFEVFFHSNPQVPLYFEYEINQLNKEVVLIIPNLAGKFYGWIPWHYEGDREIRKRVEVSGGRMEANAVISSWRAEIFFPYKLFNPLENVPPQSGTVWNANFYRLDYDDGKKMKWSWAPVKNSFHEFEKFWPIKFE